VRLQHCGTHDERREARIDDGPWRVGKIGAADVVRAPHERTAFLSPVGRAADDHDGTLQRDLRAGLPQQRIAAHERVGGDRGITRVLGRPGGREPMLARAFRRAASGTIAPAGRRHAGPPSERTRERARLGIA
jgi:hypothetical protein